MNIPDGRYVVCNSLCLGYCFKRLCLQQKPRVVFEKHIYAASFMEACRFKFLRFYNGVYVYYRCSCLWFMRDVVLFISIRIMPSIKASAFSSSSRPYAAWALFGTVSKSPNRFVLKCARKASMSWMVRSERFRLYLHYGVPVQLRLYHLQGASHFNRACKALSCIMNNGLFHG